MDIVIRTLDEDDQSEAEIVRGVLTGAAYGCAPVFARMGLPPLRDAGIRFREDPNQGSGIERFHLPWEVYEKGHGDCNDLIVYHMCDLIRSGEQPTVRCLWLEDDMHVQVRRQPKRGQRKGQLEDPAIMCGAPADWPQWLLQVPTNQRFKK